MSGLNTDDGQFKMLFLWSGPFAACNKILHAPSRRSNPLGRGREAIRHGDGQPRSTVDSGS
jgi:hypothetical protein